MGRTTTSPTDLPLTQLPCACANLRRATRAVSQLYDELLRPTGLSIAQFTLLKVLDETGPIRQGDLGATLKLDSTTLTRTFAPLKSSGWIVIRPGTDRRERLAGITAAGRRQLEQAEVQWAKAQKRLQQALSQKEWQQLFDLTYRVTQAAQSA